VLRFTKLGVTRLFRRCCLVCQSYFNSDTISDATVEWRWLTIRKMVVKNIVKSIILEGKYWENADQMGKVNFLRANLLPRGHIYKLRMVL
jgi:hypothetical protein